MIHCAPEVVHLAIDLHEDLVEVPPPKGSRPHSIHPFPTDLGGKHLPEPVPSKPDRFVADVNAAFVQQVLDVAQGKRKRTYNTTAWRMISGLVLK
jgi:hypothetical protein